VTDPGKNPDKTKHVRQRVAQIVVLGLVWALGVLALVFEHGGR
jgi:hypothetical protein